MEAPAPRIFATLRIFLRLLLQVSDMDSPAIEKRPARGCPANYRERLDTNRTEMGEEKEPFAIGLPNGGVVRLAQARRGLYERIEHGPQIKGRAADDLEHIGSGGLLLERFAKFVEQARVLDGDDGLSSKIPYQIDLLLGKRSHFCTVDKKGTS